MTQKTTRDGNFSPWRFSVAPMMDWTDRHCRYFHRLLTQRALLYSEMITAAAVLHGDRQRLLGFDAFEHPVALQLGGSDPESLAKATAIGVSFGYDEINLNCGCPSDRVQSGRFGACLMAEPRLVAECVSAMQAAAGPVPVTIKCRIGIDDQDSEAALSTFVETVAGAGCAVFIVHARKAWLSGLSPKQNRDVPPLDYDRVYRLKQKFPELTIVINGGIETLDAAAGHLNAVDGIMMGRAAYKSPALLLDVDARLFGAQTDRLRLAGVLEAMIVYARREVERGERVAAITRHMLGLMNGMQGARRFRRLLTEESIAPNAGAEVLERALDLMRGSTMQPHQNNAQDRAA